MTLSDTASSPPKHDHAASDIAGELRRCILSHLQQAEQRLDPAYQTIRTFKRIRQRHWSYPKEMLLDPLRPLLRLLKQHHRLPSRREQHLTQALTDEWLALPSLFAQLNQLCLAHAQGSAKSGSAVDIQQLNATQQAQLIDALEQQMARLGLSRDGLRDGGMIAAIALGQLISKQSSVSGSAFALGAGVGGHVYLAQQTGMSWLWIKLTGVPTWISVVGGVIGLLLTMMMLPFVGPFAEWLVWRWRGKRIMQDYLKQVRTALLTPKYNGEDAASVLAQYAQWLPDAIALLKMR